MKKFADSYSDIKEGAGGQSVGMLTDEGIDSLSINSLTLE